MTPEQSGASSPRRRLWLFLIALVLPVAILRVALSFSPDSDLNVGGYNIHHLFTGLLLVVAGGVPLVLLRGGGGPDLATVVFGVGLGLALDEWVYLIATDGSNASYLLPVSFWGGVVMLGLAVLYALAVAWWGARHR